MADWPRTMRIRIRTGIVRISYVRTRTAYCLKLFDARARTSARSCDPCLLRRPPLLGLGEGFSAARHPSAPAPPPHTYQ